MKYKIYYFAHFGLIFIISITSVINSFLDFNNFDREKLTMINLSVKKLTNNPVYHTYTIFTGTNTGYGFYGINVATQKYFSVELFDNEKRSLRKTKLFGFKNQNNLARFEVLASKMANYIVENKNFPETEDPKLLETRKLYVQKVFKNIGSFEAEKTDRCKYYTVTLYSLMPSDIWEDNNYNTTKRIGAYESIEFEL
jgi:hypothetical protein